MKCPTCGNEIPNDKLYCEKCGTELVVVSDDLDLELQMKDTLKKISDKEFRGTPDFGDEEFDDDPSILGLLFNGRKLGKFFFVVLVLLFLAVIFFAIKYGKKISNENSFDYQVSAAYEAAENDNFTKAITHMEKALKIEPYNADIKFELADYYYTLGRTSDAIYTLTEIATDEQFEEVSRVMAYRKVFSLYQELNDYSSISDLLATCTLDTVLEDYEKYTIGHVQFSIPAGTYSESLAVKLTTSGDETIYYTLDGSTPSTESEKYSTPIFLEYGSYTINAICVNEYGISSEMTSNTYLIDVAFSFAPVVEPDSGDYDHTFMIEVEVPQMYTAYYTTDGSEPFKGSNKYTGPFPVLVGSNTYKFVVYASDGTQSEIIEKTYNVTVEPAITPVDAVSALNARLIETGYLDETGCHRTGVDGTYLFMYSTIYPIEGMGDFYMVVEYIQDAIGNNTKTGNYYAIDCSNGNLYSVEIIEDSEGQVGYVLTIL